MGMTDLIKHVPVRSSSGGSCGLWRAGSHSEKNLVHLEVSVGRDNTETNLIQQVPSGLMAEAGGHPEKNLTQLLSVLLPWHQELYAHRVHV